MIKLKYQQENQNCFSIIKLTKNTNIKEENQEEIDQNNHSLLTRCYTSQDKKKVHFNSESRIPTNGRYANINASRNRDELDANRSNYVAKSFSKLEPRLTKKQISISKRYTTEHTKNNLQNYMAWAKLLTPQVENTDKQSAPKSTSNKKELNTFFRSNTDNVSNEIIVYRNDKNKKNHKDEIYRSKFL